MPPSPAAPTRTAVIVHIASADPIVHQHRSRLDRAAACGVPAHVTVLSPFVPPHRIDTSVISTLEAAVASVAAFDCDFVRADWFDSDVLWLAPSPEAPFRQLTEAVWTAFPDHPPYSGAFTSPQPHLTVGEAQLADLTALKAAEVAVQRGLPFRHHVDHALLIAGSDEPSSWRTVHRIPLDRP
ncbi:2'-5' RNA ligase family protein [Desertihabitans aurantiacus]|uniref:2'-5' RNA ligase family protein n=1 Tax=Desertihabitans aurantiacus TaxID=2282477 RepID=UPI001E4D5C5F|nr:2'-5' RNA ligase family protein [Desertihabitans aurantiacus]